jgi:hypothetical protein
MPCSLFQIILLTILALAAQTNIGGAESLSAKLKGYEEVPAVHSSASGTFQATTTTNSIAYTVTYNNLEGAVQQAHIHFGQAGVNGGIMAFLCTNLGNGPAGTQPCPAPPATVSGTITASIIVGPAGQGIAPGQMGKVLRALKLGMSYANVHTTKFTGGEIRGRIVVAP